MLALFFIIMFCVRFVFVVCLSCGWIVCWIVFVLCSVCDCIVFVARSYCAYVVFVLCLH